MTSGARGSSARAQAGSRAQPLAQLGRPGAAPSRAWTAGTAHSGHGLRRVALCRACRTLDMWRRLSSWLAPCRREGRGRGRRDEACENPGPGCSTEGHNSAGSLQHCGGGAIAGLGVVGKQGLRGALPPSAEGSSNEHQRLDSEGRELRRKSCRRLAAAAAWCQMRRVGLHVCAQQSRLKAPPVCRSGRRWQQRGAYAQHHPWAQQQHETM